MVTNTPVKKRLTLAAMSAETGRSIPHLHYVLHGLRQPSQELAEMLDKLGRPVWDLYPALTRPEPVV